MREWEEHSVNQFNDCASSTQTTTDKELRTMKNTHLITRIVTCILLLTLGGAASMLGQGKPDWQANIDWSIGNNTSDPGETNCVDQYVATEPACITGGGRACLMARAISSAKANNCSYAMRLTLITQCHNGGAQQTIGGAGQDAVCNYLKGK
jgi:hypothetical protein